jgi:hypothetical protein
VKGQDKQKVALGLQEQAQAAGQLSRAAVVNSRGTSRCPGQKGSGDGVAMSGGEWVNPLESDCRGCTLP